MKALVTGGCGFIGQHLVMMLAAKHGPDSVVVIDAMDAPATGEDRIRSLLGDNLVRGDIRNRGLLNKLAAEHKFDVVFHLAAQSHVDVSIKNPDTTWSTNAMGTSIVAEVCADHHIAMVYCSTDEVYGSSNVTYNSGEVPVDVEFKFEDSPLHPSSPYSASKAAGEMAVIAASKTYGLRYAITRGSNCFGSFQYPEKLIPIACKLLSQGKSVPLHGGGNQMRQWIHVSDFAYGLFLVGNGLHQEEVPIGSVYNLAGTTLVSVKNVVLAIGETVGVPFEDCWHHSSDRPGQDHAYCVSGDAMLRDLGFQARVSLMDEEQLRALIDHYKTDKNELRLAWCADAALKESQQ